MHPYLSPLTERPTRSRSPSRNFHNARYRSSSAGISPMAASRTGGCPNSSATESALPSRTPCFRLLHHPWALYTCFAIFLHTRLVESLQRHHHLHHLGFTRNACPKFLNHSVARTSSEASSSTHPSGWVRNMGTTSRNKSV